MSVEVGKISKSTELNKNPLQIVGYSTFLYTTKIQQIAGLVQDYSISTALAMGLLQFCTGPSI